MKKELQDQLYNKYPELFYEKDLSMKETCMCWGIECGDGWYNILEVLCSLISVAVRNSKENIKRYEKILSKEDLSEKEREFFERNLKESKSFPDIVHVNQVKEKFGTLRFYISNNHPVLDAYIDFAEDMSAVTCEVCGNPGSINDGGWLSVRCEDHKQ